MAVIKVFQFNHFTENTYVLYDETKEAVIVDPGCYFEEEKMQLLSFLKDNDLTLSKIIYTHCHLDHCFGANFLSKKFPNVPLYAHENETIFITNAHEHANRFKITMEQPPQLTHFIKEGDVISFGNTQLEALFVPGHSPGSICFYCREDNFVITGDVLFFGSIGRTDMAGGNYDSLITGIKSKLLTLPANCVCYCGHGPTTTIGGEKQSNPFLY